MIIVLRSLQSIAVRRAEAGMESATYYSICRAYSKLNNSRSKKEAKIAYFSLLEIYKPRLSASNLSFSFLCTSNHSECFADR